MKRLILLLCLASLSFALLNGQQTGSDPWYKTPEELIQDIYVAVSAKNSESVDWQKVRSRFNDEAVVILRTSRDKSTQFTADGFIQDFKDFYQYPEVKANGFVEKILRMKTMSKATRDRASLNCPAYKTSFSLGFFKQPILDQNIFMIMYLEFFLYFYNVCFA